MVGLDDGGRLGLPDEGRELGQPPDQVDVSLGLHLELLFVRNFQKRTDDLVEHIELVFNSDFEIFGFQLWNMSFLGLLHLLFLMLSLLLLVLLLLMLMLLLLLVLMLLLLCTAGTSLPNLVQHTFCKSASELSNTRPFRPSEAICNAQGVAASSVFAAEGHHAGGKAA